MNSGVQTLRFGSLLSYCPRPKNDEGSRARDIMLMVKNNQPVKDGIAMSEWIATTVLSRLDELPFGDFFNTEVLLVPIPKSSLMKSGTLWPSKEIAEAMAGHGLGKTLLLLQRTSQIPKSSTSAPEKRPKPKDHFDSLRCVWPLGDVPRIVLVDDIVTRGHTALGAGWRILKACTAAEVVLFAAVRTVSNVSDFSSWYSPQVGEIADRPATGDAIRRP